jgi:hypothetical protein
VPRTVATTTRVAREQLLEFLRPRHHAILMTTRKDGRPQSSPNTCGVDTEGRIAISTYPERAKVDGTAEVLDLPDALEPLVEYFRCISGEHPDWDEYRRAMRAQGKSLIRVTIDAWGPIATGGFPARLAQD